MKPTARTITTIIGSAALLVASAGLANAQETTPGPTRKQIQAKKSDGGGKNMAAKGGQVKKNGKTAKKSEATRTGKRGSGSNGSANGTLKPSRILTTKKSGTGSCTSSGTRSGRGGGSRGAAGSGRR